MQTTTRHPIWNRFAIVVSAALLAPLAPAAPFVIVALPDTENYIDTVTGFPGIISAQTQWIVDNRAAENIVFVTQLGDLIHHAPVDEMPEAVAAMGLLDGQVPYSICAGNHELESTTSKDLVRQNFGPNHYAGYSWYGGSYDDFNHYQILTVGSYEFLHINLQKDPAAAVLTWAQGIISQNPGKPTILSTHDYLISDAGRSTTGTSIWNGLVKNNPQVFLTLNGHTRPSPTVGVARRVSTNANNKSVLQVLQDFEDYTTQPSGNTDSGYLRKIIFDPDHGKITFKTFSPTYAAQPWISDDAHEFSYDAAFLPQVPGTTLSPIFITDAAICTAASYTQNFDSVPGATGTALPRGWSVWQIAGTGTTYSGTAPVQPANVAAATAASTTLLLADTPPAGTWGSQAANASAASGRALATNPGNLGAGVLQLKITNGMGAAVTSVHLTYDLAMPWSNANDGGSELPGYSLFWSVTGGTAAGDWIKLGDDTAAGAKVWDITMPTPLQPGGDLYLRWVDDNVLGAGGESAAENVWSIDNVGLGMTAQPSTLSWNGRASGDNRWSTASNWGGQTPLAGSLLRFGALAAGGHAANANDLPAGTHFAGITFATDAPAYELPGNSIELTGPIQNLGTQDQEIGLDIELAAGSGVIDDGGQALSLSGALSGDGPITKNGAGTVILSHDNTYTGATTINDGRFILTGSLTSPIIAHGGTLAPQGMPGTTSSLSLQAGSRFEVRLNGPTVGTQYDQLTVGGNVTLAGALDILAAPGLAAGSSFTILDKTSAGPISGVFAGRPEGSVFAASGYDWLLAYTGGDANDVVLTIANAQQAWRFTHFGTAENTGPAADTFDANADGELNLMEFATAQDPKAATIASPEVDKSDGALALTYTHSIAAMDDGVTFTVEWSEDLATDSWRNTDVTEEILSNDGTLQSVRATVAPGAAGRRFLRLKVTRP